MTETRIKAIRTGFEITRMLIEENGLPVSELAETVDMPLSTVYDYLNTLEDLGLVYNDDGQYFASLKTLNYAEQIRRTYSVFEESELILPELAGDLGLAIVLGVEENEKFFVIDFTIGEEKVDFGFQLGMQLPLHATAGGKVLLASKPEPQRRSIVEGLPMDQYTDNTITDTEALLADIETVVREQIAYNDAEYISGVRGIATPLTQNEEFVGTIAAVGLSGQMREETFRTEIPDRLREARNIIEVSLSGPIG